MTETLFVFGAGLVWIQSDAEIFPNLSVSRSDHDVLQTHWLKGMVVYLSISLNNNIKICICDRKPLNNGPFFILTILVYLSAETINKGFLQWMAWVEMDYNLKNLA